MKTSLRLAIKLILQKGGICTLDDKGMKELKVFDETELIRRKSTNIDIRRTWTDSEIRAEQGPTNEPNFVSKIS